MKRGTALEFSNEAVPCASSHKAKISCWCDLQRKELPLLPYPVSRQSVRRFKVPREASVIGRVINAWLPFDQVPNGRTANATDRDQGNARSRQSADQTYFLAGRREATSSSAR